MWLRSLFIECGARLAWAQFDSVLQGLLLQGHMLLDADFELAFALECRLDRLDSVDVGQLEHGHVLSREPVKDGKMVD